MNAFQQKIITQNNETVEFVFAAGIITDNFTINIRSDSAEQPEISNLKIRACYKPVIGQRMLFFLN